LISQCICKHIAKANAPKRIVLKICRHLKKIKNANTQGDTERQESKITMAEKLNIYNGLQVWKTEHQAVTRAKRKREVCGNLKGIATKNLNRNLTVLCFVMPASS
jgi:hypothetical protein